MVENLQKYGSTSIGNLIKKANTSSAVVNNLQLKGIIKFTASEIIRRAALQPAISRTKERITLNSEQKLALGEISQNLGKNIFTPVLLHGITGSGKTEV